MSEPVKVKKVRPTIKGLQAELATLRAAQDSLKELNSDRYRQIRELEGQVKEVTEAKDRAERDKDFAERQLHDVKQVSARWEERARTMSLCEKDKDVFRTPFDTLNQEHLPPGEIRPGYLKGIHL